MTALRAPGDDDLAPLLEELFTRHHYDFRGYTRPALERGLARAQAALGVAGVDDLLARVRREPTTLPALVRYLTNSVSELWRDPPHFRAWRERVVPLLATYPSIRVWVAGCGTGEEAYSLAVILHEAGVLERALIYATDIDEQALRVAASGCYPVDRAAAIEARYREAGGSARLSDYTRRAGDNFSFDQRLRERVLFSEHSLATDGAFAEVQAVSCRNVLIYFARALRDRAFGVFLDALCPRGFLALGANETPALSGLGERFHSFAGAERIYRRS